jgi:type VI secretion system protein ImpG
MGDLLYKHFNKEMENFEEDLKKFVLENPDKIYLLDAIRTKNKDPHIERLFSGVSFLIARLKKELETNVESISDAVIAQHWPFIWQQYPAMMIVEAVSLSSQPMVTIPKRATVVKTSPLGKEKTECVFSSISEEKLSPFQLIKSTYETDCNNFESCLTLDFVNEILGKGSNLFPINEIKLHLNAEKYQALSLYGALTKFVERVDLCTLEGDIYLGNQSLISSGAHNNDVLSLIDENNNFSEPRVIMDFFSFIEKFLFVSLKGIHVLEESYFSIKIYFNRKVFNKLDGFFDLSDKIKVNCIPVVNCYERNGEPFELLSSQTEYPVIVDVMRQESVFPISVYNVNKVFDEKHIPCYPISKFTVDEMNNMYSINRVSVKGKPDKMYFQFGFEDAEYCPVISYDAWVCNGNVPADFLRPETKFLIKKNQCSISLINLQSPTKIKNIIEMKSKSMSLMSHLGMNFASLVSLEHLKKILSLYVPDDEKKINRKRYVDCIKEIDLIDRDFLSKGVMQSYWALDISFDLSCFANAGEAILWCEVLSRFLVRYAPINKRFEVKFYSIDSEESWVFSYDQGFSQVL